MNTLSTRRRPIAAAAAALCLLGGAPAAQAALTENLATSPTAMALGNAVTADPPGVESVHFNPAGLARLTGEIHSHSFALASIRAPATLRQPDGFDIGGWNQDPLAGQSTSPVRQRLYIPGVGLTHFSLPAAPLPGLALSYNSPGSPFTFATSNYVTQAMSVDRTRDSNDPARFDGRMIQVQRLVYAAPAVGYKVSDTLSIGVSVPIAHAAFALNTDMRLPNKLLGIVGKTQEGWCPKQGGNLLDTLGPGLCSGGDEGRINPFKKAANMDLDMTAPIDPTINLGVLWEPNSWFGLGVVYQSGSKTVYSGRYKFTTDPMLRRFVEGLYASLQGPIIAGVLGLPQQIPEVQEGNMTATIPFPSHWQVGVKVKPTTRLQFNVDANYTDWGSWDAFTLKFDQSIKLLETARMFGVASGSELKLPRGYRSLVHFGFGMQAQVTDKLTLRMGYEPRKSSIPANKLDLVAPLPDTKLYSLGINYKLSNDTDISLTGSYMKGDYNVPANGSCNMNCDNFLNVIYNPYAGLDVSGGIRVRYFGATLTKRF